MDSKKLGILGEKIAENYLKKKDYLILDKNYSFLIPGNPRRGEVDIVAKKDNIISFIEVKTLRSSQGLTLASQSARGRVSVFLPEDRVDFQKKIKLIKTAESWLMKNKIPLDSKWQIDVLSIKLDLSIKKAKIRHFQNAIC